MNLYIKSPLSSFDTTVLYPVLTRQTTNENNSFSLGMSFEDFNVGHLIR